MSFYAASLLAFSVYLFTLSPENDLEFSGVYATSATYLGVSNPPAYPIWTVYSSLFIKLIPIYNVAWRVGVATVVASALTCGLIALLVSRIGALAVENVRAFAHLSAKEQTAFRIVCGCVAGMGFGLDGCFWRRAVVPDQWNFNVFLFALVLCLLTRWFFVPEQRRFLYLAALTQGLLLSDSQALFPTAYALPFLLALGAPNVGRDILFLFSLFFCFILATNGHLHWFDSWLDQSTLPCEIFATALVVLVWIVLLAITRKFFSEWKAAIPCVFLFLIGVSTYFLLVPFSMADPPMNWGYPRIVAGFFHAVSRGQYCAPVFVGNFGDLPPQWNMYGKIAMEQFGVIYLVMAAIPLLFLLKLPSLVRRWVLAMITVWFLLAQLMLVALNMSPDKSTCELDEPFFSATHFVLALLAGCGFMLVGACCARPACKTPPAVTQSAN